MTNQKKKILVVDDDEKILFAFREVFKNEGYDTTMARNGEEALRQVSSDPPHLVFMDITMPKLDGLEALRRIRESHPHLPVILITGFGTMQVAVKAIQLGAFDYLTKPLDLQQVRNITRRALLSEAAEPMHAMGSMTFDAQIVNRYELIGNSQRMQEIYKLIGSISTTPAHTSVLILGESGTGKELVARAIHAHSANANEPFIPINCTALPEALLESELFGHEKGAFTGAVERKLGKFEAAKGGTIFLDEIGNLSLSLQQKLLRVLQEREFERVGGNTSLSVKARFIAATNQDLAAEVSRKTFREDLYFRLNVAKVQLPPLRDRPEDILPLAYYFLKKYDVQLNKMIEGFSDETIQALRSYTYPGNVRELENIIERAVMLTKGGIILPESVGEMQVTAGISSEPMPAGKKGFHESREQAIQAFEEEFLRRIMRVHRGSVALSAKEAGMTRQNLQRLLSKYRISPKEFRK